MSKNLMEMIARELGVELLEVFEADGLAYKLTSEGLQYKSADEKGKWYFSSCINDFLVGRMEVIKRPKFPTEGSLYYAVNTSGYVVTHGFYKSSLLDVLRYKLGNFYLTKEEAEDEANKQKWIDFYNSAERIELE